MAINMAGFKTEWQKVMRSRKEALRLDDILAFLDVKDKKEEFTSGEFKNWIFGKSLEQQTETVKEYLSQFGEKVELTLEQKTKVLLDRFRGIMKIKRGKEVNIGAGRFNFDNLHYLYSNLKMAAELPSEKWEPGTPLKYQTDDVKLFIYDAIKDKKFISANNTDEVKVNDDKAS